MSEPRCTQRLRTHILAASDYSLVKEHSVSLRSLLAKVRVHQLFLNPGSNFRYTPCDPVVHCPFPTGGGESYRRGGDCQPVVARIFSRRSEAPSTEPFRPAGTLHIVKSRPKTSAPPPRMRGRGNTDHLAAVRRMKGFALTKELQAD